MSITNGYCTLAEFKGWVGINDTHDDAQLELAIEAASRMVDDYCLRRFYSATETRYYTADSFDWVDVDDVVSITTLKTDPGGDGTFETTWSAGDFRLDPLNVSTETWPYTRIQRTVSGTLTFPTNVRGVQVVGVFGWPTQAPATVKQATILQAHRLYRHGKEAPLGVVALPGFDGAGGMRLNAKIDPDVQVLLHRYRRYPVFFG